MRNRKLDIADIVAVLRALDDGMSILEARSRWNVSEATLYEWRRLYGGMPIAAVQRLEQTSRENTELRRQLNIYEYDRQILQAVLRNQNLSLAQRYALVESLLRQFQISVSRACKLIGVSRTLFLSRSSRNQSR
ncbi:transposase [Paraburkholderia aspalathi]|uniref:transposase n=1 Tax=Paraburkholderia aspalathi TaxID=1324617 RepID=UPI0038B71D8E